MVLLPGEPVPATVLRTPRAGGQLVPVLNLTLRRVLGVLFQPERQYVFAQQQGGSIVKRHMAFADWPEGVADPIPVHAGDTLIIPRTIQPQGTVAATPTPTPSTFTLQPAGIGASFARYGSITVGNAHAVIQSIVGDQITLAAPLAAAPAAATAVTQVGLQYAIDDADAYEGHHLEIYLRLVPQNV